jgi:multidrug efflux pump
MFITLKPLSERSESSAQVINRLREKLGHEPGATLFLQPAQDLRIGGRRSASMYQYALQGSDLAELREWAPRVKVGMTRLAGLRDVNSDQQDGGVQNTVVIDRDAAARLGINMREINAALGDAFAQKQVSIIYNALNQYYVVLGLAPEFLQSPDALKDVYVIAADGTRVPLSTLARVELSSTPLAVNHQGQFAATTISFNLAPGVSLSQATASIDRMLAEMGVPTSIRGSFQGAAQVFQSSLSSQPLLILAALITVYIVLGILYESYVHPLTILSTLPSAGVGAILALLITGVELDLIALIGILLLIGIVKKNAIMMIDFALVAEREHKLDSREAIYQACLLRFRPILMTTLAAALGALPLAIGFGDGAELRRPLGISIVGGLLFSQLLTLYTTPVVYLYLDRFRLRCQRAWQQMAPRVAGKT